MTFVVIAGAAYACLCVLAVIVIALAAAIEHLRQVVPLPSLWGDMSPAGDIADTHITDAELALLCADDDDFDWACALETTWRSPCAPDPRRLA